MDILGVLDLDGVFHRKAFVVRELAFTALHGPEHFNVKFRPSFHWDKITEKEKHHLFFVSQRITGLSVRPRDSERALPQDEVEKKFTEIYTHMVDKYGNKTVAYRGGHVERDLLNNLGIPSVDLADYQCPKFDELIKDAEELNDFDCGHHVKSRGEHYHCASVEVETFKQWLRKNLL